MKYTLVCSVCGMPSSRRYNVGRHIKHKHSGEGEILSFMDYNLRVIKGELAYPSYTKTHFMPLSGISNSNRKGEDRASILIDRSFERIGDTLQLLSNYRGIRTHHLRADVCSNCLTHKLFLISDAENGLPGKELHKCDLNWMLNRPDFSNQKDVAITLLKQKLPEYLVNVVKCLVKSSTPFYLSARKLVNDRGKDGLTFQILERSCKLPPSQKNDFLIGELASGISSSWKRLNDRYLQVVAASGQEYDWLKRACDQGSAHLDFDQLFQLFTLFSATLFVVNIGPDKYVLELTGQFTRFLKDMTSISVNCQYGDPLNDITSFKERGELFHFSSFKEYHY